MADVNPQLPVDPLLPEITEAVRANPMVLLEAEPGAGKTTRVPAALLRAGFGEVYVLEPRRLAARLAAQRVSAEMGEPVGKTVGYQVRFEEVSSRHTRLWYLTEGLLTRRFISDRALRKAKVVVLDEFHERHLETDLALALLRKLQRTRPDLRLVLMSATLLSENLASRLDDPCIIRIPGRVFTVSLRYTPHSAMPMETQVAMAMPTAMGETEGHILVFLPGAAEIQKTITACEPIARSAGARLLPLYGDLSPEQQDAAIAPSNIRKIICATNVAESSLTIDNVGVVIDSGVARVLSYSPWSGLSQLQIEKISKASATQRAGRAGRTGPGMAIRLYPESDFVRRSEQSIPEILRADLAQLLLQVAVLDENWERLPWLDKPPDEMLKRAGELLVLLRAFGADGKLTDEGRQMGRLALHPRLSRLVLTAANRGVREEGVELAARLAEGRLRLPETDRSKFAADIDAVLNGDLSFAGRRLKQQLVRSLPPSSTRGEPNALEKALLEAYSDRVARRRNEHLLLANGGSAKLDRLSLVKTEFLVAIEISGTDNQSVPLVRFASAIEPDWLLDLYPERIAAEEDLVWNRESERVEQVNRLRYEKLVIDESRSAPNDPSKAAELLTAKACEEDIGRFTDRTPLDAFLQRVQFARAYSEEIADPQTLLPIAIRILAEGLTSFNELQSVAKEGGLLRAMESLLPMRLLDTLAPTHVVLPRGRRARIEYQPGAPPSVSSRLQDFFGMNESPSIARGAVRLSVRLLAPNNRPVQVTTDLLSFWKNLYPQVRRELSRRYPKHSWPEIPA